MISFASALAFVRKPPELVYRPPLPARAAGAALAVVVMALLLALWPQVLDMAPSPIALLLFGALWLAMMAGCVWMALNVRTAFLFGVDRVASRRWWGTRAMAYADIAGCTVVHEPQAGGWHVTFEAMRRGVPPLRLFVQDDLPLDPAIVRRLKTVPGLSRRQLSLLELASAHHAHGARSTRATDSLGQA